MLSHMRMGVPYEYTHMGRPITYGPIYAYGAEQRYGQNNSMMHAINYETIKVWTNAYHQNSSPGQDFTLKIAQIFDNSCE